MIGQFVRMEIPGTGMYKYERKKALPAPNRKVARTTFAGSARLSIEAIVQRTSSEGAMAAAPRTDGKAVKISLARRSIGGWVGVLSVFEGEAEIPKKNTRVGRSWTI